MLMRIFTSIFCVSVAIAAMAQAETTDSIKMQSLNEVVIEAQMQRTSPTATTYIPTGKQKNASQNAIDLLRQIAIPQIQISPVSDAVTDNAGVEVAIFINYLEASKEEMQGLRTPDVKKVEYLEFPSDPRFRGAQRVVNIIVHEYAYGGYTKLTTNENFLVGLSSSNNIFTKFAFNKMTYDLYVGADNLNNHHIGNTVKGIYSLKNAFSAYFQYASSNPGINQKASDILQENEYMYITGNPLLKNSRHVTLNISYTWMPTNAFGMSAFLLQIYRYILQVL